jgi:hypothetical protein
VGHERSLFLMMWSSPRELEQSREQILLVYMAIQTDFKQVLPR